MKKTLEQSIPLWHFNHLMEHGQEITHFITSRMGGLGAEEMGSFNLGFLDWGDPEEVFQNRLLLAKRLGISARQLVFPRQCHGKKVAVIDGSFPLGHCPHRLASTDALVTNLPGTCICVLTADCVPIILYDKKRKVVGVAHAGWKGTVQEIAIETLDVMKSVFGASENEILVGIGPSIGPGAYEVGQTVMGPLLARWPRALELGLAKQKTNGKFLVDLWKTNRYMLEQAGIQSNNIEVSGICTYSVAGLFYSARGSNYKCGRFATGIFLR